MKLIFAGTPEFAARALRAIVDAGHEVALVLTRPDQPAGRGQRLQRSPVKQLALRLGVAVDQPRTLKDESARARIEAVDADAMVVAAYGLILPPQVLRLPRLGCINIHASLLPRWRGAAPIQRAIEAGDTLTGVTIMRMDEGLDTGPMLLARSIAIGPGETGGTLHDRLGELGAQLIVEALAALGGPGLEPTPQPVEGVTYAAKIAKSETDLDWSQPAARLADRVRAFDPFPGTTIRRLAGGEALKLWAARALLQTPAGAAPGEVLRADGQHLIIACGEGALDLLELQRPGGRRLPVAEFLRGHPVAAGERFAPVLDRAAQSVQLEAGPLRPNLGR